LCGYYHPDNLLELGKAKMRERHREREALNLAREARKFQPRRIRPVLNPVASLFRLLALKLEKRSGFGRAIRAKATATRELISLRSTRLGR
jgi:hypothetical protein